MTSARVTAAHESSTESPTAPTVARTVVSTGATSLDLSPLDKLMVDYVTQHQIPGAAIAISKQGKLVYSRGFGYAEVETQTPVEPNSLFRIASISKPITAVAVLQLVEQGKIGLEDRPFEQLWKIADLAPRMPPDPRLREITIRQLLLHNAGWDRAKSFDPMFSTKEIAESLMIEPPIRPRDIFRYMGDRPLDFSPGERVAYSNFGYCVLGRVIEQVSGLAYEEYVQQHVLKPVGITQMRLGKTFREERAAGEVCYYEAEDEKGKAVRGPNAGKDAPLPYGVWDLEVMDSHGGWIASAVDLVRFASAFDNPEQSPLLKSTTIAEMFARPAGSAGLDKDGQPAPTFYALGWNVRPLPVGVNAWHTGSLDGTSTLLVRRHDGFNWAILMNTRREAGPKAPAAMLDPLMHKAVDQVQNW